MLTDTAGDVRFCPICRRSKRSSYFYKSYNKEKYPSGFLTYCKDCATMLVDNWNPETYLWILQEADVPYIPSEWNNLMMTYARNPDKVKGTSIIGRYMGTMQLKQYRGFKWKDSIFLQELKEKEARETLQNQGFDAQEIAKIIEQTKIKFPGQDEVLPIPNLSIQPQNLMPKAPPQSSNRFLSSAIGIMPQQNLVTTHQTNDPNIEEEYNAADAIFKEQNLTDITDDFIPKENENELDYFDQQNGFSDDQFNIDLTDEDKIMLRLKWGKYYKPEEWVRLEQLYEEFCKSYDIQSAGHIDTLKLICKTSLKANQLVDLGDLDGYQKMSRVYDQLMKSGKFTAAQNKAEKGEYVDSISELVTICEAEGFIPRYYIDSPKDKVDETLQDMKAYTRSLVTEEMNLGSLIESAIKEMTIAESREEDIDDEDDLTLENIEKFREDSDYDELNNMIDNEVQDDFLAIEDFAGIM